MYFIKTYHNNSGVNYGVKRGNGWAFSVVFLLIVFVILIGFYIVEVNSMAAKNYEIKIYNKEVEQLKIDNQHFMLEKSKLSSFDLIKSKISSLGLVELEDISYLNIFEPSVAINN